MARHFLGLRLALLRGAFRGSTPQVVGLIVGLVTGVPLALSTGALLFAAGRWEEGGGAVVTIALAVLTLAWTVLPPVAFGVDDTLDPTRLVLLPLTRGQLAKGLLVAGACGIGAVLTIMVVTGATLGQFTGPLQAVLAVLAGTVQVVMCLVVARAVTTALSARLRSRKGRDVSTLLLALAGLSFAFLGQSVGFVTGSFEGVTQEQAAARLVEAADVVAITPFGWAGGALAAAGAGEWLEAVGLLVAAVALVAVLVVWWLRELTVTLETPEPVATAAGSDVDLVPAPLRWLRRGRLVALAAKDLRYLWRVPQQRVQWLMTPLAVLGVVVVSGTFVEAFTGPGVVLVVAAVPLLVGLNAFNQFGFDRDAAWLYVVAAVPGSVAVAAKNLAQLVVALPVVACAAVVLAALTGGWTFLPVALLGAVGVFCLTAAVANLTSLLVPQGMPESPTNLWNASGGQGCSTSLLQMVAFSVLGLLLVPVMVAGAFAWSSPTGWLVLVGLGSGVYGLVLWWVSLRVADRLLFTRAPEWAAALRTQR